MAIAGAFSYSPDLARPLDQLRFEVGDVIVARPLLSNEELDYLLTTYGSTGDGFLDSCAHAAEKIANRISGDPNFQRGSWRMDRNAVVQNYLDMAEAFRARRGLGPVIIEPTIGTSTRKRDPYMDIGMHDFPGTSEKIDTQL